MLHPLRTMLDVLDRRDDDAHFYFCGDYCDRGPDTKGVVDLLIALQQDKRATCVRGNHDDLFDLCLNRRSFASGPEETVDAPDAAIAEATRLFWREGILETMLSYGVRLDEAGVTVGDKAAADAWVAEQYKKVPDAHKQFFRSLPAVAETDDFFVVHATWPCDQLDERDRMNALVARDAHLGHEAIWGRYVANQIRSEKAWQRPGYVGHTPTDTYWSHADLLPEPGLVIRGRGVTLCDTGCFAPGGRLSAVCHDDGRVVQVHHTGEVL